MHKKTENNKQNEFMAKQVFITLKFRQMYHKILWKSPTAGFLERARDISSLKWYEECLTGAPQQSPWQQWLLILKQVKQQWITSNQAQSTEGVIMHTTAASPSLCEPLPPPSLSLKELRAEWLILRLLIPWECGRDWKREGGRHPVFWAAPRCSSRLRAFI